MELFFENDLTVVEEGKDARHDTSHYTSHRETPKHKDTKKNSKSPTLF